jgi:homoserine dehydrogenase
MDTSLKICVVGFGNSGQEFCRLLLNKNLNVKITAIATKTKGNLLCNKGLDLVEILKEIKEENRFYLDNPYRVDMCTEDLIKKSQADILIELSTLSIKDGQPAILHIETALNNNMHVITANKGPLAWDFKRLEKLAKVKKRNFLYETTVMDGTPIFNMVKYTLPGCKVLSFKGILNSTTNFILEEMEQGKDYESAIKEAQRRGFAEADPSIDVEGWDAAAKTAALANVLLGGEITPLDVNTQGIENITTEMIEEATTSGNKFKLICEGYLEDEKVIGKVYPKLVPITDMLSTIDATSSILCITTDLMGEVCIVEKKPEIQQTAYGIYSDLINLMNHIE